MSALLVLGTKQVSLTFGARYLEDFLPKLNYRPSGYRTTRKVKGEDDGAQSELRESGLDEDHQAAIRTIMRSDSFDYDVRSLWGMIAHCPNITPQQLIAATVRHIVSTAQKRGAILIFLSGVQEIRQCMEKLRGVPNSKVLPLHANLTSDEQRRVFASTPEWKIICSTNVAEVRPLLPTPSAPPVLTRAVNAAGRRRSPSTT